MENGAFAPLELVSLSIILKIYDISKVSKGVIMEQRVNTSLWHLLSSADKLCKQFGPRDQSQQNVGNDYYHLRKPRILSPLRSLCMERSGLSTLGLRR